MSLFGALNIGGSALAAQQAALQVTGNNLANAGNADYTRETAVLSPAADQQWAPGLFLGTGVTLQDVQRQVDESLNARLRGSNSDNEAATASKSWLSQVQASFNALGAHNISTQVGTFFSSWSSLAATPQDAGLRQVVLSDGQNAAQSLTQERSQLGAIQNNLQQEIGAVAQQADTLAQQIASLNSQIVVSSGGAGGTNNSLMDKRDSLLTKLSGLSSVQTVNQPDGSVNVYVGSEPLVIGGSSSGISVLHSTVNGQPVSTTVFKSNNDPLPLTSGQLGAMQGMQSQLDSVMAQVDSLAHNLIGAVNAIHASGQGTQGFSTVTSTNAVSDPTASLASSGAGLTFPPTNGSFVVHVTNKATGLSTSTLVKVSLTGAPTDTTLNSLAASLNGVAGLSAKVAGGKLVVASSNPGSTFSFSQDSSGALAGLGINTFFTGTDASTIAVNQTVINQPNLIAAARNGDAGDNQSAVAIAALNTQALSSGLSIQAQYQTMIDGVSAQVSDATTNAQATQAVQDTLSGQQQALGGVSIDEESISMLTQQRAYQGAAIFITTVNNMMTSLLAMIP